MEIHSVLDIDSEVTMADRQRLPYTCATLAEVQRCASIVPINILHETTKVYLLREEIIRINIETFYSL